MTETPKRKARSKKARERFRKYCERKRANIAKNSPSRREWMPFTDPIPETPAPATPHE